MSKTAVVYWSGTGNTEAMAAAVAEGIKENGGEASLFTAAEFDPKFMAEYDTHQVNLGLSAKLWKHLSLNAFTEGFDCIAGGVRYECTLWH